MREARRRCAASVERQVRRRFFSMNATEEARHAARAGQSARDAALERAAELGAGAPVCTTADGCGSIESGSCTHRSQRLGGPGLVFHTQANTDGSASPTAPRDGLESGAGWQRRRGWSWWIGRRRRPHRAPGRIGIRCDTGRISVAVLCGSTWRRTGPLELADHGAIEDSREVAITGPTAETRGSDLVAGPGAGHDRDLLILRPVAGSLACLAWLTILLAGPVAWAGPSLGDD